MGRAEHYLLSYHKSAILSAPDIQIIQLIQRLKYGFRRSVRKNSTEEITTIVAPAAMSK